MKQLKPLQAKYLRQELKASLLRFKTTAELAVLNEFIGQTRALEAVSFGIGIKSHGYNLFAMGPSGVGKRSLIGTVLDNDSNKHPTPPDWCYIYNFESPDKPIALQLSPGTGLALQNEMKLLIEELSTSILAVFESDEYRAQMHEIYEDFLLKRTNVIKLEKETSKKKNTKNEDLKIPHLYKERHAKEKELQLQFTSSVVKPLIQKLKTKYQEIPQILTYFDAVEKDIISHVNEFIKRDETTSVLFFALESPVLVKYQINLLVDNTNLKGAPVIFEEHPSYSNLIGRIEHSSQHGALATNFTLIRAGALHRANGGYLIIEARKLKNENHAWEGLKRALYMHQILIEPVEHMSESVRVISLDPLPIPLNIKVILLGERSIFYNLLNNDPDFNELFKVAVDFDEQIDKTPKNIMLYARLIGTIAKRDGLRPFSAAGVAAIVDYSSRIAEDVEKLSTHIRTIDDLVLEADYWAGAKGGTLVEAEDVKKAITAQIHRIDRTRELYYEDIYRNFILINTSDTIVGQVNCLSVVRVGKFSYGHPTRMTARVRMGKGRIIDIQREIDMAGPSHSKGSLIISNYLSDRYNTKKSFNLSASLSFEQIYGVIDGDSASVAELCALLSALSMVPIKQYLAITGSVDQHGNVQAIGGVNQKVEGFFDICKSRKLNGKQGVIIPAVNVKTLMLREEVFAAAKAKQFFIYPIETVDDAISLLTGCPAGKRNKKGLFPLESINYRVEQRLLEFAKNLALERKGR